MTSDAIFACGGSGPPETGRRLYVRHVSKRLTKGSACLSIDLVSRIAEVNLVIQISTKLWSLWFVKKSA